MGLGILPELEVTEERTHGVVASSFAVVVQSTVAGAGGLYEPSHAGVLPLGEL